jgi:hypothetical protein
MKFETPSDEIFNDIKQAAIQIWNTYDDTYGYRTEKLDRVNSIPNYKDNWWTFVGMFDFPNQTKLLNLVSPESSKLIRGALLQ